MIEGAPGPTPSIESAPFWEGVARGEFLLPRCANGHWFFPPAPQCPECWSREMRWERASGRGAIFSFVIFRRSYHPAYRNALPYTVAVVALDEGPRFLTRLVDDAPEALHVGLRVKVVLPRDAGASIPLFRLAS